MGPARCGTSAACTSASASRDSSRGSRGSRSCASAKPSAPAFANFDPEKVARFGERDVERLLGDAGIVRHRGKIEAAIANAHGVLALRDTETPLAELMWEYRDRDESGAKELSKRLKAAGFRFVGPTTAYAAMQACGIVNDHIPDAGSRE